MNGAKGIIGASHNEGIAVAEPSGPSPEVRAKLMQLREEFAKRAEEQRRRQLGQQNMEESLKRNKLPISQADSPVQLGSMSVDDMRQQLMTNGGGVKHFDNGGSNTINIDELNEALRERAPTIPEQFNRYIAPHIQRGLDAMFPFRQLAQRTFERNVYTPMNESVINNIGAAIKTSGVNQSDVNDAKIHIANAARKAVGMEPQPIAFDAQKALGDINEGEFDRQYVDMDKRYAQRLEELKKLIAQRKAKGGSVMGINVASDHKAGMHYADLIVDGQKTLESRNSDSLRPYVGKRVAIVRTGHGPAKAIGEVTIGEPMVVDKKKFHGMRAHHMVPEGSQFDIKTDTKHLYPLSDPERYDEERDVGHGIVARKVVHEAKGGRVPKNTVKAYKLFRVHEKHPGKLFPLFVDANTPVEMNKWVDAKSGEMAGNKVKSKIGPLAYRPGWHAGDLPIATHIGEKSDPGLTAPDVRPANHVWAEVEMPNDVDWQSVANERGTNAQGKVVPVKAHITDQIPKGGHYRYKTNSNMTGNWLIGGSMKVNKVLSDKEVERINNKAGAEDLPRIKSFNKKTFGFSSGGVVAPDEWKAEEHVNHKAKGGPVELDQMRLELMNGKKKFLEPSVEKGVMYHGTRGNIKKFKPREVQAYGGPDAVYVSPIPNVSNKFAERKQADKNFGDPLGVGEKMPKGANVMPLHVQVTNPFDVEKPEHYEALVNHLNANPPKVKGEFAPWANMDWFKKEKLEMALLNASNSHKRAKEKRTNYQFLENPDIQDAIKKMGHDAFYTHELGAKNLGIFDPKKIKSAIGNRGTYDTTNPDITKKNGGITHAHQLEIEERPL